MPAIRRAAPADLDAVWSLVGRAVAHMNAIGNPQWGADYPTRALYAGDIDRGEVYSIHRLAVDPAVQRQGVATALLSFAQAFARQNHVSALHVDTYSLNHRMQALFAKQGFVRRGEIYLHGRPLPYPCFEKLL